MKERPILFSAPMIRAILAGRKTQTRRVLRDQNAMAWGDVSPALLTRCPYGAPGDRLWVRETWSHDGPDLATVRACHEDVCGGLGYGPYYRATECAPDTLVWIPSIYMPRWASRITLDVTGVRIERLHDISEADAAAEGVDVSVVDPSPRGMRVKPKHYSSTRECFSDLWREINGAESWDANPWVWVIEFKRSEVSP